MAQMTEAACLLQSGTSYPRRIGFRTSTGGVGLAGVRGGGFSIYFDDEPIYHFDFEGRWQRAFVAGVHYLKGFDGEVRAVARDREEGNLVLDRRTLRADEAADLDASIHSMAIGLIEDVVFGPLGLIPPPEGVRPIPLGELATILGRVAAWDAEAWLGHRDRYRVTYGPSPLPPLPPDCPNPVVLRATGPHARSPEDFEAHARDVAALLGRRVAQNRDVFIAGPGLLRRPVDEVVALLEAAARVFPIGQDQGDRPEVDEDARRIESIRMSHDSSDPSLPTLEGWRRLKAAHLTRVTLELGSGSDRSGVVEMVEGLKGAGIGVGVVVSPSVDAEEAEATARLVALLPLGPGDLVSLIEDGRGMAFDLKGRIAAAFPSKGPRVVVYNPDKQWA